MKISETEYFVFRAIVKGIGVWHLFTGFDELLGVTLDATNLPKLSTSVHGHESAFVIYAGFHFCAAWLLLWRTEAFCRLAFSRARDTDIKVPSEG